jgi:hypothetical protein
MIVDSKYNVYNKHIFFCSFEMGKTSLCIEKMHTSFFIKIKQQAVKSYITISEATTQHLETRQWVKYTVVRASTLKTETTPHQLNIGGITESPYGENRSSHPV